MIAGSFRKTLIAESAIHFLQKPRSNIPGKMFLCHLLPVLGLLFKLSSNGRDYAFIGSFLHEAKPIREKTLPFC
jgi:hypothetical protein